MRTLTEWVFEQAFAQWAAWRRSGHDIDLSLNISSADFDAGGSHVDMPLGLSTEQRHAA